MLTIKPFGCFEWFGKWPSRRQRRWTERVATVPRGICRPRPRWRVTWGPLLAPRRSWRSSRWRLSSFVWLPLRLIWDDSWRRDKKFRITRSWHFRGHLDEIKKIIWCQFSGYMRRLKQFSWAYKDAISEADRERLERGKVDNRKMTRRLKN